MQHAQQLSNRVTQLSLADNLSCQNQSGTQLLNNRNSMAVVDSLNYHNSSGQITPQILHFILQLTVQSHNPDFAASMLNYTTQMCKEKHKSQAQADDCFGSHNSFEALFHPFSYMRQKCLVEKHFLLHEEQKRFGNG